MKPSLKRLEALAFLMDYRFRVPFTKRRVGLDGLLGLAPGVGDAIGLIIAGFIVFEARRLGAGGGLLMRMLFNIFIDFIIGSIPIFGDLFDFAWKANGKNVRLLRSSLEKKL